MKKSLKFALLTLLSTILFNILTVGSTLVLHELGHYLTAEYAGCKNIKLVLIDSEIGTYTEMACPGEQPEHFAVVGAFLFVLPFSLTFLLLKSLPEKNLFWLSLGFNLTIIVMDIPEIVALRLLSFGAGLLLFAIGEVLLIDNLFLYVERVEGLIGVKDLEDEDYLKLERVFKDMEIESEEKRTKKRKK